MNTIRMALPMLLAAAALSAQAEPATAPAAPLKYESAFANYRAYQEPQLASWKESNERVAQSPGHGGHGSAGADPHAGHDMGKMKAADPHAGHDMGEMKAADPHAGHHMGEMKAADPHAGHDMGKMKAADPHAGHDMGKMKPEKKPAPKPAAPAPDPHKDHNH